MGAKANRAYIAHVEESEWGVTPDTPTMQKMNFVSDSMNYNIETTTPDSIRDDRQVTDVINVSAVNDGGFEFEMQALASGPDDALLAAALWSDNPWTGGATVKHDAAGAVIVAGSKTIDFTGAAGGDPGYAVDQKIVITGSLLEPTNDGLYTIADNSAAPVYTFAEAPAGDETLAAGAGSFNGQVCKNGVTERSFTIERGHADVEEFFLFTGMVVNEFTLAFEAEELVTGSYTFVGKSTSVDQAPHGAAYIEPPTFPYMSAGFNVKNVQIDGMPIAACLLQSVEININNNVEPKSAVGAFEACDVSEGEFETSGEISLYFNDSSFYSKFVNSESFSLSFQLVDNEGNYYLFTLPKCKLSADTVNVEGKNTDVMDAAEYYAIYDETEGCTIRIDRFIISDIV